MDDPSYVTIAKGQLVRFLETTTRWYLALVRTVKGDQVELRFFDGRAPVRIPRTQIESFNEFLSERERKFSVERSRLTELFYGRAIERLRAELSMRCRVRCAKAALRLTRRTGRLPILGSGFGAIPAL